MSAVIWVHYAEGSLAARMGIDYRVWQLQPPTQRSPLRNIQDTMQFAEDFLGRNLYFGGAEFTAADIMMHFPINYSFLINVVDRSRFPNINEWMARVEARPAYDKTVHPSRATREKLTTGNSPNSILLTELASSAVTIFRQSCNFSRDS